MSLSMPLLETRNHFPGPALNGVFYMSSSKKNASHICMHEAQDYRVQGYNCTEFGLPDYMLLTCSYLSMLAKGVQSCIIKQNGTNDFMVFNGTSTIDSNSNSSKLVTTAPGDWYGGLASAFPWLIEKSNTSEGGYRIIKMPTPNEDPQCVTLAPDVPVTPFLDGLGISVILTKCLYDPKSKDTNQDWCINRYTLAPPTAQANFKL